MAEQRLLANVSRTGHGHRDCSARGRMWLEDPCMTSGELQLQAYLTGVHSVRPDLVEGFMVRSLPGARRNRRQELSR